MERKGFEIMSEEINVILPNGDIVDHMLLERKLDQKVKENFDLYITQVAKWSAMLIFLIKRNM